MADDAPKIEIFGDSPTTEDGLGFDDYANILLELIGNFDAKSPLTIGIHGRWGSGKTSLMRMLKKRLEDDAGVKTVWFNAWAYGRDESIGLALLQQILIEFQEEDGLQEKGIELLENVVELGIDALSRKTIAMTLEEVKNHFKNSIEIKSTLRQDFESAIDECLRDRERLVVFIDDLDRCLPEKTIEILEVIKLFLDVPKCIFVIGVQIQKQGSETDQRTRLYRKDNSDSFCPSANQRR
jgi:predicted KAP-like P-loop ATPase